jgi:hypothetical protein
MSPTQPESPRGPAAAPPQPEELQLSAAGTSTIVTSGSVLSHLRLWSPSPDDSYLNIDAAFEATLDAVGPSDLIES